MYIYRRGVYKVRVGRPDGKKPLGRLGADGRIVFKCIFKKRNEEAWIG